MIEHENIIGKVNNTMQSSKWMTKNIRALELTKRIQGRTQKNYVNAYLNCDGIRLIWKKHYFKMAHDEG